MEVQYSPLLKGRKKKVIDIITIIKMTDFEISLSSIDQELFRSPHSVQCYV